MVRCEHTWHDPVPTAFSVSSYPFPFRKSGAVGSRLTGAGWGGCTVSLVPIASLNDFMKAVRDGYYAADPDRLSRVSESLFATQPGSGAAILKLD